MGLIIEDGKGTGKSAAVDSENRLMVRSVIQSTMAHESHDKGVAFCSSAPFLTSTTAGGHYWWFKNTSNIYNYNIYEVFVSYNGGTTNHDRAMQVTLYRGASAPSANNTEGSMTNLNSNSGNTASGDVYYWDESGDGMTVATDGDVVARLIVGRGTERLLFGGSVSLGNTNTFSVYCKAEEIGQVGISVCGYYGHIVNGY